MKKLLSCVSGVPEEVQGSIMGYDIPYVELSSPLTGELLG